MCTVKLNCGHSACLRCLLRLFRDIRLDSDTRYNNYNKKVLYCSICSKIEYKKSEELLKMKLSTIWSLIDYSKSEFVKRNIQFLNERLSNIQNRKGTLFNKKNESI